MKILSSKDSYCSLGFGIKINEEIVERANERCISHSIAAKRLGMSLAKYNEFRNRNGETILRIGNKSYNTYEIAKQIVADKEKINKAIGNAWNKHAKPFIKEHLDKIFSS